MSNYLMIVLSTGICAFILESILSSFEDYKNISSAIKLIYSLCIFCAIIYPFSSIKLDLKNIENKYNLNQSTKSELIPTFTALLKEETENKIVKEIFEQFGILSDSVSIDLSIKEDNENRYITVNSAVIVLTDNNEQNCEKIAAYLKAKPELKNAKIKFKLAEKTNNER